MPYIDSDKICAHCGADINASPPPEELQDDGTWKVPEQVWWEWAMKPVSAYWVARYMIPERPDHGMNNNICLDCANLLDDWLREGYEKWKEKHENTRT